MLFVIGIVYTILFDLNKTELHQNMFAYHKHATTIDGRTKDLQQYTKNKIVQATIILSLSLSQCLFQIAFGPRKKNENRAPFFVIMVYMIRINAALIRFTKHVSKTTHIHAMHANVSNCDEK